MHVLYQTAMFVLPSQAAVGSNEAEEEKSSGKIVTRQSPQVVWWNNPGICRCEYTWFCIFPPQDFV